MLKFFLTLFLLLPEMQKLESHVQNVSKRINTYSHWVWIQDASNQFPGSEREPRGTSELSSRNLYREK